MTTDLVGLTGRVSVRIPGGARPGEATVQHMGMTHKLIAYAEREVPLGSEVWVVAMRGANAVDVQTT
jgi:hypothetical protein